MEVRLPGSEWTYRSRELLKAIGLRWDPATHAWHGRIAASDRAARALDSASRVTRAAPLESFAESRGEGGGAEAKPPRPPVEPPRGPRPTAPKDVGALPRLRDYSRTRAESHTVYRVEPDLEGGDASESLDLDTVDGTRGRRFTAWETTSGLPDDSREADERRAERQLRELRGRVKAARAEVAANGIREILVKDWHRARGFYARWSITETELREGVPEDRRPGTADA